MPTSIYPCAGASIRRPLAFFIFFLGALVAAAQTFTLTQVRNTGPRDRRINIVFVAEAFTAAEEAEFNRQADIIGNMFVNDEGFGRFADHINLFRLFVPSNEAGPDERDRGIFHDTYFNSYLNAGLIGVDDGTVAQYQRVLAEQIPDYDIAIMLINLESAVGDLNGLGRVGGGIAWVTTRPADLDLIGRMTLHEAGHAFAALRDEYVTTTPATGATPVIDAPNVSSQSARDRVAWSRFIFPGTPTPTMDSWYGYTGADAIGAFPGALNRTDLFRAANYSRMYNPDRPWGPVNLRAIATAVHRLNLESASAPPSITRQPVGGQIVLGQAVTLTIAASGTGPITYQWMRDGVYVPNGHRAALEIPVMSKQDAGSYAVEVTNSAGTTTSVAVTLTTADGPTGHWDARDIGAVGLPGDTIDADWKKTLRGSGADIGGTADAFHFAYQTLTGDGGIDVRITNFWLSTRAVDLAKAGLMLRESLQPDSRHVALLYEWSNGGVFQYRATTGGTSTGSAPADPAAGWLRILRSGDLFTGYVAKDGGAWQLVGSATITGLPATLYVGLAATSHDNSQILTAEVYRPTVTATARALPSPPTGLSATISGNPQVTLTWTDAANNETAFEVERATNGASGEGTFARIATLAADATSYVDNNVAPSTQYMYRVRATNAAGASAYSNPATVTIPATAPPGGTWSSSDIGAVGAAGSSAETSSGVTLRGSGADIWDRVDEFYYRYRQWSGDGEFIARVSIFTNTNSWAKAGLMIRESTAANSRHAFMNVSAGHGTTLQSRAATGGDTASTPATESGGALQWVKLVRSGSTITGYASTDGTTWNLAGSVTIAMPATVLVGLAVTSHTDGVLCQADFYNFTLRNLDGTTPPGPAEIPAAPTNLSATATSSSQITLSWTDASTTETGFEVERSVDNVTFALHVPVPAGTTSYTDTGLKAATTYYYRVRAVNSGGSSAYSNTASATTPAAPLAAPTNLSATAISPNRIDLAWTDTSAGEDGFRIERATGADSYREIATVGPGVASYSDTTVAPGLAYYYRVRASLGSGASGYSNEVSVTTPSAPPPPPPPNDWLRADVGAVGVAGSEDMSATPAVVRGSGSDIWEGADAFHFVYRSLSGDGTIVARITSLTDTNSWAKAGVMIRESLAAGARNTFIFVSAGNGLAVQNRAAVGGATTSTPGPWGMTAPQWVRLTRTGNSITAERSADGSSWSPVTSFTVSFGTDALVGLAVTSHNNSALCTATFTGISVSGGTPPAPPAAPAAPENMLAGATSDTTIVLSWTDKSSNETGFEIERSADNVTFSARATTAAGATSFTDSGLTAATTYYYRIRAVNAAGASAYSNVATAQTSAAPPPPPATWDSRDIGAVGRAGSVVAFDGGIALSGSGEDIWNNADEFRFYYQPMTGDGELIARVVALTNTNGWAKAGVMFRESLNANAAHGFMCVSIDHGTSFQYRAATGGDSATSTPSEVANAPGWVRLVRTGNTIAAYQSENGTAWTLVMSRTFAFPSTIYAGLAVTSHNDGTNATGNFTNISLNAGSPPPPPPVTVNAPSGLSATAASGSQINLTWTDNATNETGFEIERGVGGGGFSSLATIGADRTGYSDTSVTAGTSYSYRVRAVAGTVTSGYSNTASATPTAAPPPPPPTTWSFGDIGGVGVSGSNTSETNSITVRGSGSDIWERADSFRFVYRAMTGDAVVEAQVSSLQNTNGWAKAGVMIRESLAAGSSNAAAFVSVDHGVVAQSRGATNAETQSIAGPAGNAPYWLRVTRNGTTFTAASSPDGVTWTNFASFTIPMNATAYFGFAVTSHDNSQLNTAVFTDPAVH